MSHSIHISERAELEINKARVWYEEQSYGLGAKFINEIKIEIDSLADAKVDHKIVSGRHRRLLMYRFPFTIYYIRNEKEMRVDITRVLHNRQEKNIF